MRVMMTWTVSLMLAAGAFPAAGQTEPTDTPAPPAAQREAVAADEGNAEQTARQALAALRAEIDLLLTPAGLPREDAGGEDTTSKRQLESLASRSRQLAVANNDVPEVQYAAQQVELRAYNALAQEATLSDRPVEASYRLTQLRNAAVEAKRNRYEPADATGDFWLLVADLIDINRNTSGGDLVAAQQQATDRLETYLSRYAQDADAPRSLLVDVKSSLVRLHDQAGRNAQAEALLDELRAQLPEDDPRLLALGDVAQRCALIGQPINLSVQTTDGQTWSTEQHRGRPVLIHLYAQGAPDTQAMIDAIKAHQETSGEDSTRILSIAIGTAAEPDTQRPWPQATLTPEALGEAPRWGVTDLPRLLILNREGKLQASSRTIAVLNKTFDPTINTPPD